MPELNCFNSWVGIKIFIFGPRINTVCVYSLKCSIHNMQLAISSLYRPVKMSEAINDPVAYTALTDCVIQDIMRSTDPNLRKVNGHICIYVQMNYLRATIIYGYKF